MTNKRPPGVFCLEGEWDEADIESRQSVEPALRMLERAREIRLIHRDVASRAALTYYLEQWLEDKKKKYDFGYLGFHGSSRRLHVGADIIDLATLAELIDGRAQGKILYFGACAVFATDETQLRNFCELTGARAIAGYTKNVKWFESAAFELLLVTTLVNATQMKAAHARLRRLYPDLTRRLGLRMATADWASERYVAD